MRAGLRLAGLFFAGAAFASASPALADDWRLQCGFDGGLEAFVSYDAGGPAYELYVSTSGSSDLGRGQRLALNNLLSPAETILFTREDGPLQILLRIHREELTAAIEIGSQVGWDYQSFAGRCTVIE